MSGAADAGAVAGRITAIVLIFLISAAVLALVVWLAQKRRSALMQTARQPWVLVGAAVMTAAYQLLLVLG
jgi:succinate dehydrogenase hydrophobic anchor subunit